MPAGIAEQIERGRCSGADVFEVGFAEVGDDVPVARIDQSEHRLVGRGELADGGAQGRHAAIERRADLGELQVQFGDGDLPSISARCATSASTPLTAAAARWAWSRALFSSAPVERCAVRAWSTDSAET